MTLRALLLLAVLCATGCKIPFNNVDPDVRIADAVWFAEEETLFLFWEVEADQGLTEDAAIEIQYVTDDGVQDWVEALILPQIHPTVPTADCDFTSLCGVATFQVPLEPRDFKIRLRYHRKSELALEFQRARFSVVGPGAAHSNRSLLVYGVFDEANKAVQWRTRHTFPNLRNQQVERLGLRRPFTVGEMRYGTTARAAPDNAYLYGTTCPEAYTDLGWATQGADERAFFVEDDLPDAASTAARVCGVSTVTDAKGTFETPAIARKNPEVRAAFPVLRSPIEDATPVPVLIQLCDQDISSSHLAMQRQRVLLGDIPPTCIDGLEGNALTQYLSVVLREKVQAARAGGKDMVLAIALHHNDPSLAPAIEAAIATAVVPERLRPTPRLAGAFVLDSFTYTMTDAEAGRSTIWCPSEIPLDGDPNDIVAAANSLDCVVFPDLVLGLGPISASALPIFADRARYLSFVRQFSEEQAGKMVALTFRVPELPPNVDSYDVDPLGVATFFNDEKISAEPDDAFSYCQNSREYEGFVFLSPTTPSPLPLSFLPGWHTLLRESDYSIGIAWTFPYLLRLEYQLVVATTVSAFSASLSFGFGIDAQEDYGNSLWSDDEFSLRRTLKQCTRHCDHPTFDNAGVYQINDLFRDAYADSCYDPAYPDRETSGGSPLDP